MAKQPGPLKQARRIVGAQYAPIDYAAKQARQQAAKEQAAVMSSGKALVGLLQKGVGADTKMYDQAVNQQQALAQGAAQLLANANPNAQIQSDLAQIGAPAEQGAGLAHSLQAQFPGQGAVLNVQQGTVPGASLIAQKAAEQGYLAGLPTIAALSGQQSLRGLLANAAKEQQGFQQQRLQVGSQIPTVALDIANTQVQQRAAAASLMAENAYRQAEIDARNQSAADLNAYRQSESTQRDASQASLDRYRERSLKARTSKAAGGASLQYKSNSDGSVDIFNPRTGQITSAKGPSGGKGTSGLSRSALDAATARSHQLVAHVKAARKAVAAGQKDSNGDLYTEPTYNDAVQQALEQNIPLRIAVRMLNQIYPAQYKVTPNGLVQIGIRGQPSWGKPRKKKNK